MIPYIEHHIVDHCNLNCAGCSHFSPLAEPWYENIRDFEQDFLKLSEITNGQVGTIRLMGGEPLLHPDLIQFLYIVRDIFPRSEIQVVTNGILIPKLKEEIMPVFNEQNIIVCVSNYGLNIDLNEVLKGFNLTRVDWKGQLYNISLDTTGSKDPTKAFQECDLHVNSWYYFQNGCFYPCCIGANIQHFNLEFGYALSIGDRCISIYDHSLEEIISFLNKPIPLCKYCDTYRRPRSYSSFHPSKRDIKEWTCQ